MKIHNNKKIELIAHNNPKSAIAETFRTFRTNLLFAGLGQCYRSIMISSAGPMDGKSTIIANLAVVMAQAGKKTLLVDCDMRKPVQHCIFKVPNRRGISNCLLQHMDVEEASIQGVVENLTILTCGPIPANPAEIIGLESTRNLWQDLLKRYEYVFIDAPPALAVTDAAILSTQVDGVILVVSSATTRIDKAKEAHNQFKKANAHIIGVVLNKAKIAKDDYKYYYYYSNNKNRPRYEG